MYERALPAERGYFCCTATATATATAMLMLLLMLLLLLEEGAGCAAPYCDPVGALAAAARLHRALGGATVRLTIACMLQSFAPSRCAPRWQLVIVHLVHWCNSSIDI